MTQLKAERIKKNLSLKEVSEQLGITFQYLSLLEKGRRFPSWDLQQRLVQYFNIPAEKLLAVSDSPIKPA